jgi:putative ABC transport system permease protein
MRIQEWLRRLAYLARRASFDDQLDRETEFHIDMRRSELENSGLPSEQALAQARQEFGSVLRVQEASRETWHFQWLEQPMADIRYAVRQLSKDRTSALISIISLALGIGATTAVFSVIYGVLLNPYPYSGADRMVTFRVTDTAGYNGFSNYLLLSAPQLKEFQNSPVLDGVIATDSWDMAITGGDLPEAVHTGKLSANAFEYFGVPPVLGREFTSADGPFGQEPQRVVVLSYHFWQSHYGGSTAALGQTLQLDHEDYTVIGVVPPRFAWFHTDVYIPLRLTNSSDRVTMVDARLKPGITTQMAVTSLTPLIREFERQTPAHFPRQPGLQIEKLNDSTESRYKRTLIIVFIAVGLFLVVGSTNVALLLLARAAARQHELSIRAAIGASRGRIIRQLVTEALLLAATGCLAGVALAYWGVPSIVGGLPDNSFPNAASIHVNVPVLLFAVLISVSTGILCGLWPAIRSSRPGIAYVIQSHTSRVSGTRTSRQFQRSLIAAQAALTVVLLAAAGASIRTFLHLYQAPLGYDPSRLLTVTLQFPDGAHTQLLERQRFYAEVRKKVANIPEVKSAAIYPFGFPPEAHFTRQLELFDQPTAKNLSVTVNPVSLEFFKTLKIPVLQGSIWSEQDTEHAAHVALVNEAFMRRYWPATNPIAHKLRLPDFTAFTSWMVAHPGSNDWLLVLGVVGNIPNEGLSKPPQPAVYLPYSLVLGDSFNLAVRTEGNPMSITKAVREAVHSLDGSQPINQFRTAEDILSDEGWATQKFVASLFTMFSALALILAAIGLYSVISFAVTQSYQEFGIRMALGAPKRLVLLGVLFAGIQAVLIGLAIGFLSCLFVNDLFRNWTEGTMYDPLVLLSVSCVFLSISVIASIWPAWRACTVDPMAALRHG